LLNVRVKRAAGSSDRCFWGRWWRRNHYFKPCKAWI